MGDAPPSEARKLETSAYRFFEHVSVCFAFWHEQLTEHSGSLCEVGGRGTTQFHKDQGDSPSFADFLYVVNRPQRWCLVSPDVSSWRACSQAFGADFPLPGVIPLANRAGFIAAAAPQLGELQGALTDPGGGETCPPARKTCTSPVCKARYPFRVVKESRKETNQLWGP